MQNQRFSRNGWSLGEVLAVVMIGGVLAALILPRFAGTSAAARKQACETQRRNLEVQVRLWHRTKGVWPANDLSDIAADPAFLPEGLPVCPVDSSTYVLDGSTHVVAGHSH
jgi:type II secretory pathway pseudopilin PulG